VALEIHHPRINSEPANQLTQTRIDGIDPPSATGQESRGKTSGARTHVKGHPRSNLNRKEFQSRGELQIAAETTSWQDPQRRIDAYAGCGIRDDSSIDEDAPSDNDVEVSLDVVAREQIGESDEARSMTGCHFGTSWTRTEQGPSRGGGPRALWSQT
jgi:hypothetical protein